jgi:threonine dehydrogenase-like Zn-dependent dehydrogenase
MLALWLEERSLRLRDDVARPEPSAGEALLRVRRAGICNTDLELLRGYYPFRGVPGHEFVAEVEAAPGAEEWVGKRVVGEINAVCGACTTCRAGRRRHCENRTVVGILGRDGAFAERLVLPVSNLHPVPDHVPDDDAVFTEPLAAALEIQEQVPIGPADRVLVVGDGKLGNLVAQTLSLTGCELLIVGRHPSKLALLGGRGIATALAPDVPARCFDVAVECTGGPEGFELARRALRPRGTLVLKSTYAGRLALDVSSVVVDELTLVGSRCGPMEKALALLSDRRVGVRELVQARYPLRRAVEAFAHASRPGTLKVLVDPV